MCKKQIIVPDHLSKMIAEYKPKVDHGELEWEPEPFFGEPEPLIDEIIPNKIVDIPKPDNKMAGNAAHLPTAKVQRDFSNQVRASYEWLS